MITIVMVGNVGGKGLVEVRTPKLTHIPSFDELVALKNRYCAYMEYAESARSRQTANDARVVACSIKRHMDKMYKRWRER
jgi:hypothetical protein